MSVTRRLSSCVLGAMLLVGPLYARAANPGLDQAITVDLAVSPEEIPFHHVARYTVTVEAPMDATVEIAPWADEMPGLDIAREPLVSTPVRAGWQRVTQSFLLTPSRPRTYELPAAAVLVNGTRWGGLAPQRLEVRELTPEELDAVREPVPPVTLAEARALKGWGTTPLWLALLLGSLVVAALGGWGLRQRRYAARRPWEVAEADLQTLLGQLEARKIRGEVFYVRLADILRDYGADRYGVNARELSTPELAETLRDDTLNPDEVETFLAMLASFDRVKFAQRQPVASAMKGEAEAVLDYVRETATTSPFEQVSVQPLDDAV